jgi:LPXTG-site transpeptidase (sortase) family protein
MTAGTTVEPAQDATGSTAPPVRREPRQRRGARRAGREVQSTDRARADRAYRAPRHGRPGGGTPPAGRSRLPAPAPRPLAPRDGRWWTGAALLTVSVLLLGFVAHVAVFSRFQHERAQTLSYGELRGSLARAETPVGPLDVEEDLVAPGTPVALLQIPAIGLSEVVTEGTTSQVLRSGPGHRRDTAMPGQPGTAVLVGRQTTYGGPFGALHELVPGDEIAVTTGQGEHRYRVLGLRRAGDPEPAIRRSGEGRLELQTADGLALFPSGVLHVDATLVSEVQEAPRTVIAYEALPSAERAMGQDTGAWWTAFFVLVFLVAAGVGLWWLWTTWGRRHAWLIGVPVLLALGVAGSDVVMNALPNVL